MLCSISFLLVLCKSRVNRAKPTCQPTERTLHSGPLCRGTRHRGPVVPLFAPAAPPSPRLADFGFSLKDYPPPLKLQEDRLPPNSARRGSPFEAPLMNFKIRRSIPLFIVSAPRPFPLRGRPAQTLPLHSRPWKFITEPRILLRALVMLRSCPSVRHEDRPAWPCQTNASKGRRRPSPGLTGTLPTGMPCPGKPG